ncbi:hypothetical protein HDU93_008701 [Gonapodya sp. JEL0774]|nr:hypothetical protein HDU93_008701 [Gonapodya sp. JEL0774]
MTSDPFLLQAIEEAEKGLKEGGVPIGSVIVLDGKVIGRGHNQRHQHGSAIHHGEMNALGTWWAGIVTSSPRPRFTGAILLYKIPRVIIGENETYLGEEELLKSRGVEVTVVNNARCRELMQQFIAEKPEMWAEDTGETTEGPTEGVTATA